jgi:hypothetical protein
MPGKDLFKAVADFEKAARGDRDWRSDAQPLARHYRASVATLWQTWPNFGLPVFETYNSVPAFDVGYKGWAPLDPNFQYIERKPLARVVHDRLFITDKEKIRHPYCQWESLCFDLQHRMMGKAAISRLSQVGCALLRHTPFDDEEILQFSAIHSRIFRALLSVFELSHTRDEQRRG